MRLINTKTLVLHEFIEGDIPPYGILSHTWGPEEVTFQDWLYIEKIKAMTGYVKITAVCWQATQDALDWIWVDTNCIDKTNSAELSEAINSMFRWYQQALKCYVLLADVSSTSVEDCHKVDSDFRNSRWFTRGWTLQELLAPPDLVFFSKQWMPICRRDEIATTINDITKIPERVLGTRARTVKWYPGQAMEDNLPIAEIMSWASNRKTTRIEDEAYCLLGVFNINMPLLYGEGPNAFRRLQLEIIQRTTDLSFLAWQERPLPESTDDTLFKPLLTVAYHFVYP
ncbi:HET-domain-containing protein [Coniochaeta sp. PMI_546]|nr:HET-domain-containing protein [Coniochaeta sp. PMI_546]